MSRTFNAWTAELSEKSGCDWDFLIDMYNWILNKDGDVDWERFERAVMKHDWSIRNGERFENLLVDLSDKTGYTYSYLFNLYTFMVYDPYDGGDWDYFVGVTMEHDW